MRPLSQRPRDLTSLVQGLLDWFGRSARDLPWRHTTDPYAIWISEIMLQQTQVKTVIAYWTRWMKRFPDARSLARARPQEVLKLWEGLGYYARARNAQAAAQVIVEKFGGAFPSAFEDILALPGVGRYTAGAVCSIALNRAYPIVDGNVARVLCRIFAIERDPREKTAAAELWSLAEQLVELASSEASNVTSTARTCSALNQSLMELGALICTPLQPKCAECPVRRCCAAFGTGMVDKLPIRKASARVTRRRFVAFIVERDKRFLTRQRPAGGVNAHFWEFPNIEVGLGERNLASHALPFTPLQHTPFCRVTHTITRYRIELTAHRAEVRDTALKDGDLGVWRTVAQMRRLPFTSAHKRILERLADSDCRS